MKEGDKEYSLDVNPLKDLKIEEKTETVNVVVVPRIEQELKVHAEVPNVGQVQIQTNWVITEKENGLKHVW